MTRSSFVTFSSVPVIGIDLYHLISFSFSVGVAKKQRNEQRRNFCQILVDALLFRLSVGLISIVDRRDVMLFASARCAPGVWARRRTVHTRTKTETEAQPHHNISKTPPKYQRTTTKAEPIRHQKSKTEQKHHENITGAAPSHVRLRHHRDMTEIRDTEIGGSEGAKSRLAECTTPSDRCRGQPCLTTATSQDHQHVSCLCC